MKITSDILTVSFDSGLKDVSALCVTRKHGEKTVVLKVELGEQADILYHLLTEQMSKEYFQQAIKALEQEHCDYYDTYNKTCRRSEVPKEPCEDAISRTELLKAIDTWDKFGCDANGKLVPYQEHYIPYIHYDDVIKCIKGMTPVTPQTMWIPISERLPEESGYYLTTVFIDDCYFSEVCMRWFAHPDDYSITTGEWRECADDELVTAWMPLPEPCRQKVRKKE